MKISIIIPIYNVEPYIGRCLNSCLNQNISEANFEIICIDDGCTDGSMKVVEQFALQHSNIVILHQQNAGQSAARNHGMRIAKGDYVWFVDSDDWVQPNILKDLLNQAYSENLDTLCFTFQYVDESGVVSDGGFGMPSCPNVIDGKEFIYKHRMPAGPWSAIHRRKFLLDNGIAYIEGVKREDEDYTIRAYCSADRISYVNTVAYNYFQRTGSTMKSEKSVKTAYDLLVVADSLYDFAYTLKGVHQNAYWAVMNRVSFAFSQSLAYFDVKSLSLDLYKQKPYYPLSINRQLSSKDKWKYRLMNLSLNLYLKIYKLK